MGLKKSKAIICLLLIIGILVSGMSFSYAVEDNLPKIDNEKISKELSRLLNSKDEYFDILVKLKEEAEIDMAVERAQSFKTDESNDIKERKAVIGALKEVADSSQVNIENLLIAEKSKGNVKNYKKFFIVNSFHIICNKAIIEKLSRLYEVELIDVNSKIKNEVPIKEKTSSMIKSSLEKNEIEWNLKNINADKAWELGAEGEGVIIGILDSAVDYEHPALKDNFLGYDSVKGTYNFADGYIDCISGRKSPNRLDDMEHGSHSIGIALGSEKVDGEKSFNIIGVAPKAKWINARVFGNGGESTTAGFLEAAEWMLAPNGKSENAPQIINNSWGGRNDANPWFRSSVKAWIRAGILPVFAAGNQTPGEPAPGPGSISNPGNLPEAFAVGAVNENNKLAYFSKKGPSSFQDATSFKPEVSSPGVRIRSSVKNGYMYMSGTSMAAPHVAGVAALVKGINKGIKVDELREILEKTSTPARDESFNSSPNHGYGYGVINAFDAVSKAYGSSTSSISGFIKSGNAPLAGNVEIVETGRVVSSDHSKGLFTLRHAAGTWTLKASAYGYKPEVETITLNGEEVDKTFNLVPKKSSKVSGYVKDNNGNFIKGASVRFLEESNIEPALTDDNGFFEFDNVYEGNYTLRVFKDNNNILEEECVLLGEDLLEKDFVLNPINEDFYTKETKFDNGKMNPKYLDNALVGGAGGAPGFAVKFVPERKNGTIENVSINFYDGVSYANGEKLKLSIYTLDERGRNEILLDSLLVDFKPSKELIIPLLERQIKTDKPYYVLLEKPNRTSSSYIIGLDRTGDSENSYAFYDGNFIPFDKTTFNGALMIRSSMQFRKGENEIVHHVEKPKVNPILPFEKIISGNSQSGDRILIILPNGARESVKVKEDGTFSMTTRQSLDPGSKIIVYAKDINGISSEHVEAVVRTDNSELKKIVQIAEGELPKVEGDTKESLKENLNKAKSVITQSDNANTVEDISAEEIRDLQGNINSSRKSIKIILNEINPLKKVLDDLITESERMLIDTVTSYSGNDIPNNKNWVRPRDWSKFSNAIVDAKISYDNTFIEGDLLNQVIEKLKGEKESFASKLRKGKKIPIIIDEKYQDGNYEGEGRGNHLVANHVLIQVKSGKIVKIDIVEWNDSKESLDIIEKDGFIERIISENSLDVRIPEGAETQARSIIKAIIQALGKALKEGETSDADKTELNKLIAKCEGIIKDVVVSLDGHDLENGEKWVFDSDYNNFKRLITEAKDVSKDDSATIDAVGKAYTLLYTEMRIFEKAIKTEPLEIIVYKDGEYIIKKSGKNPEGNTFKITIKDGAIYSVEIIEWGDTEGYDEMLINSGIFEKIVKDNTPEVDVVTGATLSSNSLKDAVREALIKASSKDDEEEPSEDKIKEFKTIILNAKIKLYLTDKNSINTYKRKSFINLIKESQLILKNKNISWQEKDEKKVELIEKTNEFK